MAKAVKCKLISFLGACGYFLCKLFRVSTALDFVIVPLPPRCIDARRKSLSKRRGHWRGKSADGMTIPQGLEVPPTLEQASRRTAPRYHPSHRTTEQQPSRSRRQHSPRSWQASGGSRARLSSQLNQRVPLWISVNCAPRARSSGDMRVSGVGPRPMPNNEPTQEN